MTTEQLRYQEIKRMDQRIYDVRKGIRDHNRACRANGTTDYQGFSAQPLEGVAIIPEYYDTNGILVPEQTIRKTVMYLPYHKFTRVTKPRRTVKAKNKFKSY